MQEIGIIFDKVGYSSKELLDYSRKDLEGQAI